ncbi:MAG TPA: NUDIX hydrolase [Bacteroidota bacterium]|nr:NUDIX hydrolase [Bacteroidota bacterium]
MQSWKTLKRSLILDHSKWLSVEDHTVQLPDGKRIENWPWVNSPDYVNVVPIDENNNILCFRQVKYAVEGVSLAPVGGYLDEGETPLVCAKRELKEEMGCEASEWVDLGSFPVDGNHGCGMANLFLAKGVRKLYDTIADDLEEQELVTLSISEVRQALLAGEFKVLSWSTAVAFALLALEEQRDA